MVETFGAAGMSSEDSGSEDEDPTRPKVFKVMSVPWRRNIERELQILESMHAKLPSFKRQGRVRAQRIRDPLETRKMSTRNPVVGLPESFYDREWHAMLPIFLRSLLRAKASPSEREWKELVFIE